MKRHKDNVKPESFVGTEVAARTTYKKWEKESATDKQYDFLLALGYDGSKSRNVMTKAEASIMIDELKALKQAAKLSEMTVPRPRPIPIKPARRSIEPGSVIKFPHKTYRDTRSEEEQAEAKQPSTIKFERKG